MQVFINGALVLARPGFINAYEYRGLNKEASGAFVSGGDNVIAAHCLQTTGGQYIDVGVYERQLPMK